ncbi:hypothetical protein F2P56_030889 [Juglans regia]|uniref:Endonuclease MutS2 n=2 Tax=Juglans regia TaxID=51240 RepID=A0A2I4F923_JUGRE|nr:endonuclease MutS2 [Juglans regia]KAF5450555.1 hypothetical protein F2P56_030889 [Juglans regia]
MDYCALFVNPNATSVSVFPITIIKSVRFKYPCFLRQAPVSANLSITYDDEATNKKSSVHHDSLRVLEWGSLCDAVASFAGTSLGREATKAQLCSLNQTYEESLRLLEETNAAVEMHKHGGCRLDFGGIDAVLVKSAILQARRSLPVDGNKAMAVAALLQLADTLQFNLKAAIKEDEDWYRRFMPLTEDIMGLVINRSLVKFILQVIDEDGSVKDSASSMLKHARDRVRMLERKIYHLMESLIRNEKSEASFLEVSNIDGRWCIKSVADRLTSFKGLLLSSGSVTGSIVEPLSAVPLNDELQQARASAAKAEADVLSMLSEKMQMDLDEIEQLLDIIIRLDVVNARATYSLSFGGTCPDLFLPEGNGTSGSVASISGTKSSKAAYPIKREWTLYLPKAYNPLLLQQHRQILQKARKDVSNATNEIRRQKQGEIMSRKGDADIDLLSLEMQVTALEQAQPVPVDFFIDHKTRVLVITGPNTGGKTICLKTVGLAAMMAKSGLHVLASESVKIPWFDAVFADIGDEQSLSQSLSTFSGHLKRISDIQSHSTSRSLVLLDEVGAGTNPLEGAALGMSLLESFAETGALLTIATTHHGELKTLKYSNDAFENACMEFDEVNLKPTFKILWGVPGRSNAINIAERLGLPSAIVDNARELYGAASAEIDEVITDMERFKQDFKEQLEEAQHHVLLSKDLYENLLVARRKIMEHSTDLRLRKMREISEAAAVARSILHRKVRQHRASVIQSSQPNPADKSRHSLGINGQYNTAEYSEPPIASKCASFVEDIKKSPSEKSQLPKIGDIVYVSSLGRRVTVLRVEPSKNEIVVQSGNMKLKLKLNDVQT